LVALTDALARSSTRTPDGLDIPFEALVRHGIDGIAVSDGRGRFVYANRTAEQILGASDGGLLGTRDSIFERIEPTTDGTRARLDIHINGGPRTLDVTATTVGTSTVYAFRDETEVSLREKKLTAFVQTAATVASVNDNAALLGEIASSVLEATGEASCTLVLFDELREGVQEVGTAGGYPDDYGQRLTACLHRGAPLASRNAYVSHRPVVAPGWRDRVLEDPRWEPVHDILREHQWGSLVAVPLMSQGRTLGSITLFYRIGHEPQERDVDFLSAIGGMAAVAIINHELAARMARDSALEERHRIARDLHDSVSQTMFSISLRCRALQLATETAGRDREDLASDLAELHQLATGALADMREMILHLRPEGLEREGLIGLVRRKAAALEAQQSITTEVVSDTTAPDLPHHVQLELLRIVQEAMGNAARHSDADRLRVSFTADFDTLTVCIRDNGRGFVLDTEPAGHFGLTTMAERASSLGATLTIKSRPGCTEVVVAVPLRDGWRGP